MGYRIQPLFFTIYERAAYLLVILFFDHAIPLFQGFLRHTLSINVRLTASVRVVRRVERGLPRN